MFKQLLDGGAFGVIVPHCDTRRISRTRPRRCAIRLQRRPRAAPRGVRGAGVRRRRWGLARGGYAKVADLWPLDPPGELLLVPMVESREAFVDRS